MERNLSVDDLVGGIFRLGNAASMGIGRTDSEAAFQEFLKRIPSASNLAAIAGSAGQLAPPSALDATALPLHDTSAGGPSGLGGIPRVSSLDFLARLVNGHQSFSAPAQPAASSAQAPPSQPAPGPAHVPPIKMEPASLNLGLNPADIAASLNASSLAALSAMPGLTGANPLAAAAHMNPAAAAAAALQLQGQLGQLSRLNQPPPMPAVTQPLSTTSRSDGEVDKSEQRRARRMLSNRESARRSRRRKQEHLSKLELEIQDLQTDRKALADKVAVLERRAGSAEEENKRLREENERLRDELRFLRSEITDRKERSSWRREHDDDEHSAKRCRTSEEHAATHCGGHGPSKARDSHDNGTTTVEHNCSN